MTAPKRKKLLPAAVCYCATCGHTKMVHLHGRESALGKRCAMMSCDCPGFVDGPKAPSGARIGAGKGIDPAQEVLW